MLVVLQPLALLGELAELLSSYELGCVLAVGAAWDLAVAESGCALLWGSPGPYIALEGKMCASHSPEAAYHTGFLL